MCDHRRITLFGRVSSSICIRQSSRKLLGEGDYIAMHTISSGIGCSIERYCQYCSMKLVHLFYHCIWHLQNLHVWNPEVVKTYPSCALLPFWSGVWLWNQIQWSNSTPTSRFCISKLLKRSRWSFTMKTFQLYWQHWWQWPKPGPFGSKTSLVAMGAVVDGLKIIFLKTSPMWLASWWVLMGKTRKYLHSVDIFASIPTTSNMFSSIKQTKHSARYTCQLPQSRISRVLSFSWAPFSENRQANHESISWGPHHKTSNKQSTVAFLEAYSALKPENNIYFLTSPKPKRFVGETHVLCDVTEYLDDFTWPSGQDLSQSSKN